MASKSSGLTAQSALLCLRNLFVQERIRQLTLATRQFSTSTALPAPAHDAWSKDGSGTLSADVIKREIRRGVEFDRKTSQPTWVVPETNTSAKKIPQKQKTVGLEALTPDQRREIEMRASFYNDPYHVAIEVDRLIKRGEAVVALNMTRVLSSRMDVSVSWNYLISHFIEHSSIQNGIKLFNEMRKRKQRTSARTYTSLFRSLGRTPHTQRAIREAVRIYIGMLNGTDMPANTVHMNAVLTVCARGMDLDSLYAVSATADGFERRPDSITFNIMFDAMRNTLFGSPDMKTLMQKDREAWMKQHVMPAVRKAKALWDRVVEDWAAGSIIMTESLVCSFGRLLLLGPRNVQAQVFLLLEQTMGIPVLVKSLDTMLWDNSEPTASPVSQANSIASLKLHASTLGEDDLSFDAEDSAFERHLAEEEFIQPSQSVEPDYHHTAQKLDVPSAVHDAARDPNEPGVIIDELETALEATQAILKFAEVTVNSTSIAIEAIAAQSRNGIALPLPTSSETTSGNPIDVSKEVPLNVHSEPSPGHFGHNRGYNSADGVSKAQMKKMNKAASKIEKGGKKALRHEMKTFGRPISREAIAAHNVIMARQMMKQQDKTEDTEAEIIETEPKEGNEKKQPPKADPRKAIFGKGGPHCTPQSNTLAMVIRACTELRLGTAGEKYWDILTRAPYNVTPDSNNWRHRLQMQRRNHNSTDILTTLRSITDIANHDIVTSMMACLEDKANPSSLANAMEVLQISAKALPITPPSAVACFVELIDRYYRINMRREKSSKHVHFAVSSTLVKALQFTRDSLKENQNDLLRRCADPTMGHGSRAILASQTTDEEKEVAPPPHIGSLSPDTPMGLKRALVSNVGTLHRLIGFIDRATSEGHLRDSTLQEFIAVKKDFNRCLSVYDDVKINSANGWVEWKEFEAQIKGYSEKRRIRRENWLKFNQPSLLETGRREPRKTEDPRHTPLF